MVIRHLALLVVLAQSTSVLFCLNIYKATHNAVFDLYFPPSNFLIEEQERLAWRTHTWKQVKHNQEIRSLLEVLMPPMHMLPAHIQAAFPDIINHGFTCASYEQQERFLTALRRDSDTRLSRYAFLLRTTYISMAYANPLTNTYAGVTLPSETLHNIHWKMPAQNLRVKQGYIVHNEGPIDYLIIGSGPAGCVIAHELARQEKNIRIVMLEAGSLVKPYSITTASRSELMESGNRRTNSTGGIIIRNGWTVGGGTRVNIDLAFSPLLPCIRTTIQQWIDNGWVKRDLFHDQDNDWQRLTKAYAWVAEKLHTRTVSETEINTNNRILWQALPTSCTYALNAYVPNGTPGEILKISAFDALLLPALQAGQEFKNQVSILPDAKVSRIICDNTVTDCCATGVEVVMQKPLNEDYIAQDPHYLNIIPGTTLHIAAKNIIIAAGTLGSAAILLRSDIPNKNIGHGIIIHPSLGIFARFNKKINALEGLPASVYAHAENRKDKYFFEAMATEPAFIALLHQGSGKQIIHAIRNLNYLGGFGIMLVDTVQQNNRVFINPETNTVEVAYTLSEPDKKRFRTAIKRGLTILLEQGAQEIFLPTAEPLLDSTLAYIPITTQEHIAQAAAHIQFTEYQTFLSSAHMQGSNKMGNNPETSVVSPNFRVWNAQTQKEIPNLYVVDSSIFPTSIGANPMQSVYTIAKLFVDYILFAQ